MSNYETVFNFSDVQNPEDAETFRDLFGDGKFNELKKKFSEKVHGGKKFKRLISLARDANQDEYAQIRDELKEEMSKRVPLKKATARISIGQAVRDSIAKPGPKREKAKQMLGQDRYNELIGYPNNQNMITDDSIRSVNPDAPKSHAKVKQEEFQRKAEKAQKRAQQRQDEINALTGGSNE